MNAVNIVQVHPIVIEEQKVMLNRQVGLPIRSASWDSIEDREIPDEEVNPEDEFTFQREI